MMEKAGQRLWYILSILSFVVIVSACEKPQELGGCKFPSDDEYKLVWSDEFNGNSLDTTIWSYDLGDGCDRGEGLCGWGNNELQIYTNEKKNVQVVDSMLVIRAFQIKADSFTSGRIVTKNKADWKYGRIDVRAKIPTTPGIWSAIWMLPTDNVYGIWPKSGEIDIMENIGSEPDKILGTIHYGHDFWRYNSQELTIDSGAFHDDFHVYSVVWTDQCIQFLMDGKNVGVPNTPSTTLPTTWPFDQKFHMILNIAVGGNLPGPPIEGFTTYPQLLVVDYVRVYQTN